jgi:hypothetical protein
MCSEFLHLLLCVGVAQRLRPHRLQPICCAYNVFARFRPGFRPATLSCKRSAWESICQRR